MSLRIAGLAAILASAGMTSAGFAADIPGRALKPTPPPAASAACKETSALANDVFGFTTGSDVNDVGALSGSVEYNGNYGARFGRVSGHLVKAQLSYSPFLCFEIGPTIYGTSLSSAGTTFGLDFRQFGGTVELKYKLLGRATHGVGLTISSEPGVFDRRYSTFSNAAGFPAFVGPLGSALKPSGVVASNLARVLIDAELVKDKLYGAVNLEHFAIWDDPISQFNGIRTKDYAKFSNINIRASLSYKLTDTLFVGVEGSHQRAYLGTFANRDLGNAWFAGPTFYWQATEKLFVTGSYNYQFAGKTEPFATPANVRGGDFDLLNFNRHLAKFEVGYSF